ncbi:hypothetical protein F5Y10DRAFT_294384 [Nemania abortiva]|nr:hypothetical protein F5Y10DRAFT_294384 [Nemania abortiva]
MQRSPNSTNQKRSRPALEILYPLPTNDTSDEAEVDIIAVHGLGSDVDWAWTWKDGDKQINWLQAPNMLPTKVPKSRIIAYSYESKWHVDAPKTRLELCGEELIHSLDFFYPSASDRPIIFIGHSLGGNVIVDALLYASREGQYQSLLNRVVGLVFLGTPFRGTKSQWLLSSLTWLMQLAGAHDGISRDFDYDEPRLLDKMHYFCRLCNKSSMPVSCFWELYKTDLGRIGGFRKELVVEEASACIPGFERYALQTDHKKINKYGSPSDRSFESVSGVIARMCAKAKDIAGRRRKPRSIITNRDHAIAKKPDAGDCLRDLFITDPLEDRNSLRRRKGDRASGTCEWILGTEELTTWLRPAQLAEPERSVSNLLWLHGNPGTGKSTLAIFITDELSRYFTATDGKTLAYFFCDSAYDTRKTATSVIRGLLLQLIQQHPQLLDYLLPKYKERKGEIFKSFDTLWPIFLAVAADEPTGPKYCIIDALDECDTESQETLLWQFEQTFRGQDVTSNLRILVTSRPNREIQEHLQDFMNRDLASFPERRKDVDRCIDERVNNLAKKKKYTDKVKKQVLEIIRAKAEDTFLWVGIVCDELQYVFSKDAVQVLHKLPKGLHSLYKNLLDTAVEKGASTDNIRHILACVLVYMRQLKLLQLSEVCQLHQEEDDPETLLHFMEEEVASCRQIVVVSKDGLHLLHKSVRDFLAKNDHDYHIDISEAHAYLAYRSIDALIKKFHHGSGPPWILGLSNYATYYWIHHARAAGSKFVVNDSNIELFAKTSPCRDWWLIRFRSLCAPEMDLGGMSIWHVAAKWGIPALVDYLSGSDKLLQESENSYHLDSLNDKYGVTPIALAALSGHLEIVPKMLDLRWEDPVRLMIHIAQSDRISKELITLLLDRLGEQVAVTEEALISAAKNKRRGNEIMELFLGRQGNKIAITEAVLVAAAGVKHSDMMKLLLDRRSDQITITEAVLVAAVRVGYPDMIELLLDRQGDRITITEAVLIAAVRNRYDHNWIIKLLLDRQGDRITITEAVLVAAAGVEYSSVMKLLLDRRGDQITITEAVLVAAAGVEYPSVMKLLLDRRGNQITITEGVLVAATRSPWASYNTMALLLDQGGEQIIISEKVLSAAARHPRYAQKLKALLLNHRGRSKAVSNN